jgi:hypothetical protein
MAQGKFGITGADLCVGRVLHEDDDFMTIEVVKNEERPLNIESGDRYLTLLFVRQVDGAGQVWKPWKDTDGG